jgi:hypothetical protein
VPVLKAKVCFRPNPAVADGPSDAQKRTFDPLQELAKR